MEFCSQADLDTQTDRHTHRQTAMKNKEHTDKHTDPKKGHADNVVRDLQTIKQTNRQKPTPI